MELRRLTEADWPAVARIYEAGIATGMATFEPEVPSYPSWDAAHHNELRLVACREGHLLGWAAASPVSDRCCYGGVVEESVYVDPSEKGRGVGHSLLETLLVRSEQLGIWTVQAGIFPENAASLALHQSCGFRLVGRRERLGQLAGVWRDVLLLERRSPLL